MKIEHALFTVSLVADNDFLLAVEIDSPDGVYRNAAELLEDEASLNEFVSDVDKTGIYREFLRAAVNFVIEYGAS